MAINLLSIEATSTQNERIRGLSCIHTTSPPTAQTGDLISLPERRKMLHGGLPQGGEIVSEYSNAWIDMRHDNVIISAFEVVWGPVSAEPTHLFPRLRSAATGRAASPRRL